MNTDIRLSVDFWDHPKTLKLERKLGMQGVTALLRLWCWAGKYRPDGYLSGMDSQDVAIAARWKGSPEDFISTLIEIGWIDEGDPLYLHDWQDHQPWAVGAPERSERARKAALAKHNKCSNDAKRMRNACDPHAPSMLQADTKTLESGDTNSCAKSETTRNYSDNNLGDVREACAAHATSNAGSTAKHMLEPCPSAPSPSPSPLPSPKEDSEKPIAGSEKTGTRRESYPEDFDRAWKNHPRQDGSKHKACKKWLELKRMKVLPDLPTILGAQDRQKQSRQWKGGFVPYFQTWLNGREWETAGGDGGKPVEDRPWTIEEMEEFERGLERQS